MSKRRSCTFPQMDPEKRKINQKWFFLLGGVLGLLYLMFVVYGSGATGG